MTRIGFWQLVLDDRLSWWEAKRINEAADAADLAGAQAETAHYATMNLATRMQAMSREIIMLRTAITVLVQTLKDTNVVDEKLLDARLEAAMEAAVPPPVAHIASPFAAGGQPSAAEGSRLYTCLRCRQQVPASSTLMTADGPVCERCPSAG